MQPSIFLITLLVWGCLSIKLPGLDDVIANKPLEADPPPYIPFAAARVVHINEVPSFKDAPQYHVYNGEPEFDETDVTAKAPKQQESDHELRMESLLDKVFGNKDWRLFVKNPALDTTIPSTSESQDDETSAMSSGFFNHQISAGNLFNLQQQQQTISTKPTTQPHSQLYVNAAHQRNNGGKSKTSMKYSGSFISTNLHGYKDPKTTTKLPVRLYTMRNQATVPPQPVFNIPTNQHQLSYGQQITDMNNFRSDLFDPDVVNNVQSNYNPYNNPGLYATQTGSNPQNLNFQIKFDADKINTNYMEESKQHIEHNLLPGVLQAPSLLKESDNIGHNPVSGAFQSRLPNFDASQLNQALLDKNWMFSEKKPDIMSPAFLTGNVNRPGFGTNTHPHVQEENDHQKVSDIDRKEEQTAEMKNEGDNKNEMEPSTTTFRSVHPTVKSPDIVHSQFDFVPGNLYPGVVQRTKGEEHQNSAHSIVMPLFDPNTVNAQQMVFNPNSISWVKSRTYKRAINERKLNQNKSNNNMKESFGDFSSFTDNITTPASSTIPASATTRYQNDAKDSFGRPQTTTTPNPPNPGSYAYAGFNPNQLNTKQGQANFVPGQMTPYGSATSNQFNTGDGNNSQFYNPSNGNGKLLNFNIGSLLGMATSNSNNAVSSGFVGAFNPTSLNKMMMASLNTSGGFKGGNGSQNYTFGVSFDSNASKQGGSGSTFGYGFDVSANKADNSQNGSGYNSGFMNGGFDANAANVGFGNVLKGGDMTGFGFGSSSGNKTSTPSAQESSFGTFGMDGGFDAKAANVGFGATDYGMGTVNGQVGAFGGSFNADMINAGLLGTENNSSDVANLISYFLGVKMTNEGGGGSGDSSGLYDQRFIGTFNPDSVNHVSYDPNKFNNIKAHFNPMDMLAKNPGMDENTLTNTANLFDPDKVNSLYKQQAFNPSEMLQYIPGVKQQDNSGYQSNDTIQQTGSSAGSTQKFSAAFDPFETMKHLMENSKSFQPGSIGQVQTMASIPAISPVVNNTTTGSAIVSSPTRPSASVSTVPDRFPSTTTSVYTTMIKSSPLDLLNTTDANITTSIPSVETSTLAAGNNSVTSK